MDRSERARAERAKRRRQNLYGERVALGAPKTELYAGLSPIERFRAMAELCRRQWLMSGRPPPELGPRHTWPGEKFQLPRVP